MMQPLPRAEEEVNRRTTPWFGLLPPGEHGPKTGLGQYASDCLALVALNFDPSLLHRAPGTTGLLHLLGECLLFRETETGETRHDCHGLATAMCSLANDIYPPTVLLWCEGRCVAWGGIRLPHLGQGGSYLSQCREWTGPGDRLTSRRNPFLLFHRFIRWLLGCKLFHIIV